MNYQWPIIFCWLAAVILFAAGLRMFLAPASGRRGNALLASGTALAVLAALLDGGMGNLWAVLGLVMGGGAGVIFGKTVNIRSVQQMLSLFTGCGGLACLLTAWTRYHDVFSVGLGWIKAAGGADRAFFINITIVLAVLAGGAVFSASLVLSAKLAGLLPRRPLLSASPRTLNPVSSAAALLFAFACVLLHRNSGWSYAFFILLVFSTFPLGGLAVLPLRRNEIPVVVPLLAGLSGLAAAAAGFMVFNPAAVVAGALAASAGVAISGRMARVHNLSLSRIFLRGTWRKSRETTSADMASISVQDAFHVLESARTAILVPGYGMAAAQAHHAIRELGDALETNGTDVRYAIHPASGRAPGHMSFLLAEAGVPYEKMAEPEEINPDIEMTDVVLAAGANDIVNPAALEKPASPLYGMPIIEAHRARAIIVLKRGGGAGYYGVENPLFGLAKTRVLFGDARGTLRALASAMRTR